MGRPERPCGPLRSWCPAWGRRWPLLLAGALLAGCNDTSSLAPASPDTPWHVSLSDAPPGMAPSLTEPAAAEPGGKRFVVPATSAVPWPDGSADVDPAHRYSLAELIDIAERRNQTTRIAWEQARQAAIAVGMARAAYLPTLTASALGGYQRIASPFPSNLVRNGYITANAQELFPEIAVRYLLLDFGARDAAVAQAGALSFAANVTFTAAHQTLILQVARAYFTLDGVDAQLRAAQQTLASARLLQDQAEALNANGLGTIVDVQTARRGTAQARFDVAAATTAQHQAHYGLLAALDLPPTAALQVTDSSTRALPKATTTSVAQLMHDALRERPDLLADLARLRAAEAGIAEARAAMAPKLSISGNVQGNLGRISVDGGPYEGVEQPQAGVFLRLDWPLYQGGLLRNRVRLEQSQQAEAQAALADGTEQALREVALANDAVDTGLSQYDAAAALLAASQTEADSAAQAYRHGVGTFTEAMNGLTALAAARATAAKAHAQALVDAASLAFATGALTSSLAPTVAPVVADGGGR